MKIEGSRRAQIEKALKQGLDAPRLQELLQSGATPTEVRTVLDGFGPDVRAHAERLLASEIVRTVEVSTGGSKAHDVRAQKRQPWWSGVEATTALLHPEPTRDVEVHGERFSKDDVASMLRSIGR